MQAVGRVREATPTRKGCPEDERWAGRGCDARALADAVAIGSEAALARYRAGWGPTGTALSVEPFLATDAGNRRALDREKRAAAGNRASCSKLVKGWLREPHEIGKLAACVLPLGVRFLRHHRGGWRGRVRPEAWMLFGEDKEGGVDKAARLPRHVGGR
jgi:hypothetical protein